jgi:predicted  nucleic acid-binding Zn-ribbon protein
LDKKKYRGLILEFDERTRTSGETISKLQKEIEELKLQLAQSKESEKLTEEQRAKVEELTSNLKTSQTELAEVRTELTRAKKELAQKHEEYDQATKQAVADQTGVLQRQIAELKSDLQRAEEERDRCLDEKGNVEREKNECDEEKAALEEKVSSLETQLEEARVREEARAREVERTREAEEPEVAEEPERELGDDVKRNICAQYTKISGGTASGCLTIDSPVYISVVKDGTKYYKSAVFERLCSADEGVCDKNKDSLSITDSTVIQVETDKPGLVFTFNTGEVDFDAMNELVKQWKTTPKFPEFQEQIAGDNGPLNYSEEGGYTYNLAFLEALSS